MSGTPSQGIPPGKFSVGEVNSEPFPERSYGKYEDVYDQFEDMAVGDSFPIHFGTETEAAKARGTLRRSINARWGPGSVRMAMKGKTLFLRKKKELIELAEQPQQTVTDQPESDPPVPALVTEAQPQGFSIPQSPFASEVQPRTLDVGVPDQPTPPPELPPELAVQMDDGSPKPTFQEQVPDPYAGMSDAEKMIRNIQGG